MRDYSDIERVFELVAEARAREAKESGFPVNPLAQDEKQEAYNWADGQDIKNIVDTPGFDVIMMWLEQFMDEGIKTLMLGTVPTDKEAVLANFAIAHAATEVFNKLKIKISNALDAAQDMPEVLKQGIRVTRGVRPVPAEMN
jgi:hypothetical protein